ncbi:MAG: hypothetical protein Q9164_004493 [Protoblastenia rupestris]
MLLYSKWSFAVSVLAASNLSNLLLAQNIPFTENSRPTTSSSPNTNRSPWVQFVTSGINKTKQQYPQARLLNVTSESIEDIGNARLLTNFSVYFDHPDLGEMILNKSPNDPNKWGPLVRAEGNSHSKPTLSWPPKFGIEVADSLCKAAGMIQTFSRVSFELDLTRSSEPTYTFSSSKQPLDPWYIRVADKRIVPFGDARVGGQGYNSSYTSECIGCPSKNASVLNTKPNSISWTSFITTGVKTIKKAFPHARITNVISQASDEVASAWFLADFYIFADDPKVGGLELKNEGSPMSSPKWWDSEPKRTGDTTHEDMTLHWPPVFDIHRAAELSRMGRFDQEYHYVQLDPDPQNPHQQIYKFFSFDGSWFVKTIDNSVQPGLPRGANGLVQGVNAHARIGTS